MVARVAAVVTTALQQHSVVGRRWPQPAVAGRVYTTHHTLCASGKLWGETNVMKYITFVLGKQTNVTFVGIH